MKKKVYPHTFLFLATITILKRAFRKMPVLFFDNTPAPGFFKGIRRANPFSISKDSNPVFFGVFNPLTAVSLAPN
jgi:hypothetical protein